MMRLTLRPDYLAQFCTSSAFLFLAQALPLGAALRLGEWAGRQMTRVTRQKMKIATGNLVQAYPRLSGAEAWRMARRVYEHFGRAAVESAMAHRLIRLSTWRDHIAFPGEGHLREVLSAGKGGIFVTAHLGVWEIFSLLMHRLGVKTWTVYRPVKNPLLDRALRRRRASFGQRMVPRDGALRTLLRVLRGGGYIALLVDQHSKADGIWVPFFGRPASTTPAPALLALRTGAPIVTGCARRVPGIYRFEMRLDAPMWVRPSSDREADVRRVTCEISRRIEGYIRETPEQWLWLHRRWRRPPAAVAAQYEAGAVPEAGKEGSGDAGSTGAAD